MESTFSLKLNTFFVKILLLLCLIISGAITWHSVAVIKEHDETSLLVLIPVLILIGLVFLLFWLYF